MQGRNKYIMTQNGLVLPNIWGKSLFGNPALYPPSVNAQT